MRRAATGPLDPIVEPTRTRKRVIAAAVVALILGVLVQVVPFTGPWYSKATQVGDTTLLYPTWRAALAPPWAYGHAWTEAQQVAPGMPATDGVYDQFLCHWVFARPLMAVQSTWGLDAGRPHVGLASTALAACNPNGPG